MMKIEAAVIWGTNQEWQIEEVELHPPQAGEVLVKTVAAGLCHSDNHYVTGDFLPPPEIRAAIKLPDPYPAIGGHEGAGIVLEVGAGVTTVKPGDHIATSFIPSCGRCRWCVTGRSNICDLGALMFTPGMITDGTNRHFVKGQPVATMAKLGTFASHMVLAESSVIKIDDDLPLPSAALVSCGVATGWGSAVHRAETQPGDTVVVIGIGGVGMSAVQGAHMASARYVIAVDPFEFKQKAALDFGATHAAASIEEALPLVTGLTEGRMAERVILTPGVLYGDILGGGLQLTAKDGTCVVTAIAPITQNEATINLFELAMYNKALKGTIFGSGNPRFDIPNLLSLYRSGQLKLDELITTTYRLDQVNQGYQDMKDGKNIRGVILFD